MVRPPEADGSQDMPEAMLHVTEASSSSEKDLTRLFRTAFQDALGGIGEMDGAIYDVEGFCGRKFRLFLNNLVRSMAGDARYLEVGVFKGATLCPVISGNTVRAIGIDNWSWDKDNVCTTTFYKNLAKFKTTQSVVSVIENNFRNVNPAIMGKNNIYFYDGSHEEKDQYDGIAWAIEGLDDTSIVLVDDWNWPQVRRGTMNALRDAKVNIDYVLELRTTFDDSFPTIAYGTSDWHNGFFGAVISK
jgi:hypothetical protein